MKWAYMIMNREWLTSLYIIIINGVSGETQVALGLNASKFFDVILVYKYIERDTDSRSYNC